ncbi:hypothetical protein BKA61DRAFT_619881 [Leptodontidium sp. MPI-SDFR-AT-0119]|nr:hypothetical protein BKA61DRAFT_619881 [Leptodontidium sp. MPI-SDFR-AT-0119]
MPEVKQEHRQDDNIYVANHLGRTQAEDLAPYSARSGVSSFNLPLNYGSTLVTPVSMTSSPSLTTKSVPAMHSDLDVKLSPGSLSPTYGLYSPDSDFYPRYNPPMKHKDSTGVLHISTADNFFPPGSPFTCPSPYYGDYGVSAPSQSGKTSNSSPSFHHSPNMQSAGGCSSSGYYSRNQTPALSASSYKSSSQTPIRVAPSPSSPPILIAPNPSTLKPATAKLHPEVRRQAPSDKMSRPFQKPIQERYSPVSQDQASKVQKASKKKKNMPDGFYEKLMAAGEIHEMTAEERVLLQLVIRDDLPWKAVMENYNATFPAKQKQTPALQMKKMRLIERLQPWTAVEKKALELSVEANKGNWKAVAKNMSKFGAKEKWSSEACQKQWEDMQGRESLSQYEMAQAGDYRRHRTLSSDITQLSTDEQSWSDEALSVRHSPFGDDQGQLVSSLSTATMDNTRSRTASDASVHMQMQQQHLHHIQQQMVYSQQNQQSYQPRQQQQRQYNQPNTQHHQAQQPRNNSWAQGA